MHATYILIRTRIILLSPLLICTKHDFYQWRRDGKLVRDYYVIILKALKSKSLLSMHVDDVLIALNPDYFHSIICCCHTSASMPKNRSKQSTYTEYE